MAEFIYFKVLDLELLSFYDFFDNSDIFNATLAITFEKLFWMVIEEIIDSFINNKKSLIIIQLVITSLMLLICSTTFLIYIIKTRAGNINEN